MNQLTAEQIKTLGNAFASYAEVYEVGGKYRSMEGIQEQLDELNGKPGFIFYISSMIEDESGDVHCTMSRMVPGENASTSTPTTECVEKEPTENQIRRRMELTLESYYTARENLREEAYGATHSKQPGQSWGDYWKSY
jgi:hypothetical protein